MLRRGPRWNQFALWCNNSKFVVSRNHFNILFQILTSFKVRTWQKPTAIDIQKYESDTSYAPSESTIRHSQSTVKRANSSELLSSKFNFARATSQQPTKRSHRRGDSADNFNWLNSEDGRMAKSMEQLEIAKTPPPMRQKIRRDAVGDGYRPGVLLSCFWIFSSFLETRDSTSTKDQGQLTLFSTITSWMIRWDASVRLGHYGSPMGRWSTNKRSLYAISGVIFI